MSKTSIVIPAKNESASIGRVVGKLRDTLPDAEVIVVNDASTDDTAEVARKSGADVVLTHPYSMGNGAAIKTGARAANAKTLVCMDADGQHKPEDLPQLLSRYEEGFDMVVGARDSGSQAGKRRHIGNHLYNRLASMITGHRIEDLTSGFRVVDATKFREFLHLLPNGFSYPTTITMAFFRSGYPVAYVPITANKRKGKSHIRLLRDGLRFLLIIFRIGTLYSPLKVFFPVSALFFIAGLAVYIKNYIIREQFTNMSAMLMLSAILVFLIGLVSEQITNLLYATGKS